jgi:hypothetical protein
MDVSPFPVPRAGYGTHTLPSDVLPPNSGLTQYECGRMKPLLCAKQSSTGNLRLKPKEVLTYYQSQYLHMHNIRK